MATHSTSAAPHQTTVTVDIVSGPSEPGTAADFELQHARRVLARLKSLLGRQGLMDLLARDIEEGNAFLREMAELSQGELRSATTVLAVHGLRALDFLRWLGSGTSRSYWTQSRAISSSHPTPTPRSRSLRTSTSTSAMCDCRPTMWPWVGKENLSQRCWPNRSTRSAGSLP